ncbi:Mov34/MPN/PAD-1 family protein [Allosphingosinicella vermicomposti]|uniref:Mov34/MPN/PAD-1 family protein n=1 Tax=Allosphingosinicella vermicomposti TaxID=614671 RepID=UPI000D10F138|nr:M67 family metallopeptidase [Allosphingosinicella vermicomposti]
MGYAVKISRGVLARLRNEAAAAQPAEICGLLVGRAEEIQEAVASPNLALDPKRGFELDPCIQLPLQRQSRGEGRKILGHYHSHPSGDVRPSLEDERRAGEAGALWLIVSGDAAALWVARQGVAVHGRFDPVKIAESD